MKSDKDRKSIIYYIGTFGWLILSLLVSPFDKTLSLYFFGMTLVSPIILGIILEYALPYIENNQRKSNQNIVIYIFQVGFRMAYNLIVYILILLTSGIVISLWFGLPLFFFLDYTRFYYEICLPLLGGIIGETIWGLLYFGGMSYLGYLVYEKIKYNLDKVLEKILNFV